MTWRVVAAAASLALSVACTDNGSKVNPTPPPMPIIGTAACPGADQLLAAPAPDGRRLPDVELNCLGHPGSVPMRRLGRIPTVVNLWAGWCAPCAREMPAMQRVSQATAGRVLFLGVDTKDNERVARETIQATGVSYASVVDPDEVVRNAVNTIGLPTTLLIGTDGRIRKVFPGELTEADLRTALRDEFGITG